MEGLKNRFHKFRIFFKRIITENWKMFFITIPNAKIRSRMPIEKKRKKHRKKTKDHDLSSDGHNLTILE